MLLNDLQVVRLITSWEHNQNPNKKFEMPNITMYVSHYIIEISAILFIEESGFFPVFRDYST